MKRKDLTPGMEVALADGYGTIRRATIADTRRWGTPTYRWRAEPKPVEPEDGLGGSTYAHLVLSGTSQGVLVRTSPRHGQQALECVQLRLILGPWAEVKAERDEAGRQRRERERREQQRRDVMRQGQQRAMEALRAVLAECDGWADADAARAVQVVGDDDVRVAPSAIWAILDKSGLLA